MKVSPPPCTDIYGTALMFLEDVTFPILSPDLLLDNFGEVGGVLVVESELLNLPEACPLPRPLPTLPLLPLVLLTPSVFHMA